MTTAFKLAAAILGLAVASAAITDASAKTAATGKTIHATATKVIVHKTQPRTGLKVVKSVRIVHRAPLRAKLVKFVATKAVVRVVKRPLPQRQVFAHRVIVKKTLVR